MYTPSKRNLKLHPLKTTTTLFPICFRFLNDCINDSTASIIILFCNAKYLCISQSVLESWWHSDINNCTMFRVRKYCRIICLYAGNLMRAVGTQTICLFEEYQQDSHLKQQDFHVFASNKAFFIIYASSKRIDSLCGSRKYALAGCLCCSKHKLAVSSRIHK